MQICIFWILIVSVKTNSFVKTKKGNLEILILAECFLVVNGNIFSKCPKNGKGNWLSKETARDYRGAIWCFKVVQLCTLYALHFIHTCIFFVVLHINLVESLEMCILHFLPWKCINMWQYKTQQEWVFKAVFLLFLKYTGIAQHCWTNSPLKINFTGFTYLCMFTVKTDRKDWRERKYWSFLADT